jgi:hypothetical protein
VTADPLHLLGHLDALSAKATAGPWNAATAPAEGSDQTHAEYLAGSLRPGEGRPLWVSWALLPNGPEEDAEYVLPVVTGDGPTSEANAALIVAARNALPMLVTALRGVLELHAPFDRGTGPHCQGCATHVTFTHWPCATVLAITDALGGVE